VPLVLEHKMKNNRLIIKVVKSNRAINAQLVDLDRVLVGQRFVFSKGKTPVEQSKLFGEDFGKKVIKATSSKITFDRGRFLYHGKIKSFAEGLRSAGLDF